jgi:hypothetical protein
VFARAVFTLEALVLAAAASGIKIFRIAISISLFLGLQIARFAVKVAF